MQPESEQTPVKKKKVSKSIFWLGDGQTKHGGYVNRVLAHFWFLNIKGVVKTKRNANANYAAMAKFLKNQKFTTVRGKYLTATALSDRMMNQKKDITRYLEILNQSPAISSEYSAIPLWTEKAASHTAPPKSSKQPLINGGVLEVIEKQKIASAAPAQDSLEHKLTMLALRDNSLTAEEKLSVAQRYFAKQALI